MMKHYVYRRPLRVWAARILDAVGSFLVRRGSEAPERVSHWAVLRLDHIGDAALAEPALRRLRELYPRSRITLITTPEGKELLEPCGWADDFELMKPVWFHGRGDSKYSGGLRDLTLLLRRTGFDAAIDLRGDLRHIWSMFWANPKAYLVSYGSGGGGFLLNREDAYDPDAREIDRGMKLVEPPNGSWRRAEPSACLGSAPLDAQTLRILSDDPGARIAVHPAAGSSAKSWPIPYWKELLNRLGEKKPCQILWIGDESAGNIAEILESMLTPARNVSYLNLCGKVKLSQLGSLFRKCDLLISPDSGPIHIAAAQKTPTLVIYSGTNRHEEWGPVNPNARIVSNPVPCSPCRQRQCPLVHHACMEDLRPEVVLRELESIWA